MANQQPMPTDLSSLQAPEGSNRRRTRVGRGKGSGLGKTAGRGQKGQTSRSGKGRPRGFEGGQMPLQRRLPKFGFKNPTRRPYCVVNLSALEERFSDGDVVDPEKLIETGLVRKTGNPVKILGQGTISKKLQVKAHKFSKSAIQKINQAGGNVEEIKIGRS